MFFLIVFGQNRFKNNFAWHNSPGIEFVILHDHRLKRVQLGSFLSMESRPDLIENPRFVPSETETRLCKNASKTKTTPSPES